MAKDKEFEAAVAAEVAKQLKKSRDVAAKELTQDQFDILQIVAPNRAARGGYKIVEPETVEE